MIAIVDYGMGNLASVYKAVRYAGRDAVVTSDIRTLRKAGAIILPGVGAMADAMRSLSELGLSDELPELIGSGRPFLGICLGLQMLFDTSDEGCAAAVPDSGPDACRVRGLGILAGEVRRIPEHPHIKIPHMGWNKLSVSGSGSRFISGGEYVYFVHSYYARPDDFSVTSSHTRHGIEFAASIEKDNIFATQFHPEKSGEAGIRILSRWIGTIPGAGGFPGAGVVR